MRKIGMYGFLTILALTSLLFFTSCASGWGALEDAPVMDLSEYNLVFEDHFEGSAGTSLDNSIWEPHANGPRRDAVNTDAANSPRRKGECRNYYIYRGWNSLYWNSPNCTGLDLRIL